MLKTSLWVVVTIIIAIGAFLCGSYYHYSSFSMEMMSLLTGEQAPPLPPQAIATLSTTTPAQVQLATISGQVTAVSATSVTIQTGYNQTSTFAISNNIPVYSAVFAGQTGKGISDIKVGDRLIIHPTSNDPTVAAVILFVLDPSIAPSANQTDTFKGTVTALSGSTATITPTSGAPVVLTLTSSTNIVTTVTAGQVGRTIAAGDAVTVDGVTTSGGETTASLIVLGQEK